MFESHVTKFGDHTLIDQRLKIAVFIDFDNIEIGVKTTLHTQFDIAAILEGIKERGEVAKVAYGDWKRAGDYGRLMSQHAIRMVQRNLTPGGDKNGADINLALDALGDGVYARSHQRVRHCRRRQRFHYARRKAEAVCDKKVFVVGGRQFTSQVMQKNCHEFIAYENLVRRRDNNQPRKENGAGSATDIGKAVPLIKRALKVLSDREVSPQLGLLKEHAPAARFHLLRARLWRQHVPRFHREARRDRRRHVAPCRSMMVDAVETEGNVRSRRQTSRRSGPMAVRIRMPGSRPAGSIAGAGSGPGA